MNVNNIFSGQSPFSSGHLQNQQKSGDFQGGPANMFQKLEEAAIAFHQQKNQNLQKLSSEDLLRLDQEIFNTKLNQDRMDMLEKTGITENLLDKASKDLQDMYAAANTVLEPLQDLHATLTGYDDAILGIQDKRNGKAPMKDGEDASILKEQLKQLQEERLSHIEEKRSSLISSAREAETIIHGIMNGLQENSSIWDMLSSGSSQENKKSLEFLAQTSYGMVINPREDIYSSIMSSATAATTAMSSMVELNKLVEQYRLKLNLEPSGNGIPTDSYEDSIYKMVSNLYLQNSMTVSQDQQESRILGQITRSTPDPGIASPGIPFHSGSHSLGTG